MLLANHSREKAVADGGVMKSCIRPIATMNLCPLWGGLRGGLTLSSAMSPESGSALWRSGHLKRALGAPAQSVHDGEVAGLNSETESLADDTCPQLACEEGARWFSARARATVRGSSAEHFRTESMHDR